MVEQKFRRLMVAFLIVMSGWLVPLEAEAQSATSGAIGGEVRDSSGGVLPGVTVEIASPALIEKVRTAITDHQGRYTIVDLRPGVYGVTFTLPGFNTFKREGIEVTTGFNARVDGEMRVGSIEETVTVSGVSPVVDTQNVAARTVVTREVLDTLPTAQNFAALGALTLGATTARDVGGSAGDRAGTMSIHGSRTDGVTTFDGLATHSLLGPGARRLHPNQMAISEMTLATNAMGAEAETGGVAINIVPKDGGNTFHAVFDTEYTGKGLQNDNFSDDLIARGLTRAATPKYLYTVGMGLGGPIKKDTLWFYTAPTRRGAQSELAGLYYNKVQNTLFYERDLSRPAFTDFPVEEYINARLTWQATAKQKVTFTAIDQPSLNSFLGQGSSRAPEASAHVELRQILLQGGWTYPVTTRLLLEASAVWRSDGGPTVPVPPASPTDRAVQDQGLGLWYGSHVNGANPSLRTATNGFLGDYGDQTGRYVNTRAAMNYVTGSHAAKVGFTTQTGSQSYGPSGPFFDEAYRFRDRIPNGLWQIAGPGYATYKFKLKLGVFAEDQWTLKNLTLNLGVRMDHINAYSPEQIRPAGKYSQEYHFTEIENVPKWTDFAPRVGASYDIFGNGRTAVKVFLGKYFAPLGLDIAGRVTPGEAIAGTVFRTWNDTGTFPAGDPRNGNYVPDCNLHNPLANGECGQMDNLRFGQPIVTRRYDPDYLTGSGNREYSWQGSVSVQHELVPRVALNAGYYRTSFGNATVTDNLSWAPSDFDEYCITAPVDPRLPGGGGNRICGLYDIKPEKFGQVDDFVTLSSNFGKRTEVFNGVDVGMNARIGQGALLFGGVSTGKTVIDDCAVIVDSPQKRFCHTANPATQFKLAGAYPLPWWGLQLSAVFQNLPGIDQLANVVVSNAQIAPTLGRNLGQCRGSVTCNGTVTVDLIEPGTMREPRQNQLDIRLTARVKAGPFTLEPKFDIYNATNANDLQGLITRFGATWLNATGILPGRTFKFGVRAEF